MTAFQQPGEEKEEEEERRTMRLAERLEVRGQTTQYVSRYITIRETEFQVL